MIHQFDTIESGLILMRAALKCSTLAHKTEKCRNFWLKCHGKNPRDANLVCEEKKKSYSCCSSVPKWFVVLLTDDIHFCFVFLALVRKGWETVNFC